MKKAVIWSLLWLWPAFLPAQGNAVRLDDLLKRALERNPLIKAAGFETQAMSYRIPQAKSLPDPMVDFDLKNMGFPQFTLGQEVMSGIGVSFSQAVPFPGKLRLRGEIAGKAYERQKASQGSVVLGVLQEVKAAYFELFVLHKSVALLREQKTVLEKAAELTETKYQVGRGTQSDVLKARIEIVRMDEMITPMAEMIRSLEARLNLLLDLPPDRPLGVPEGPAVEALPMTLEEVKAAAAESSPMVREAALMVEESQKMMALARKELSPDFVLGGGWEYKGRLPSMYEVMVGFEIPLYRKTKQSKMIEESAARLESSRSRLLSARNDLAYQVTDDFVKARTAESLVKLYEESILKLASLAVDSSLASYRVDKTDFLALLTDIATSFSYRQAYYRQLGELWSAIARLEKSVGREIVDWGGVHDDAP